MLKITKISALKSKRQLNIYFEQDQIAILHKLGKDIYSEVSVNIPKSQLESVKTVFKLSDYFLSRERVPSYADRITLEMQLKPFIGKQIKEVKEL